jgi:hypothetical protein
VAKSIRRELQDVVDRIKSTTLRFCWVNFLVLENGLIGITLLEGEGCVLLGYYNTDYYDCSLQISELHLI